MTVHDQTVEMLRNANARIARMERVVEAAKVWAERYSNRFTEAAWDAENALEEAVEDL